MAGLIIGLLGVRFPLNGPEEPITDLGHLDRRPAPGGRHAQGWARGPLLVRHLFNRRFHQVQREAGAILVRPLPRLADLKIPLLVTLELLIDEEFPAYLILNFERALKAGPGRL